MFKKILLTSLCMLPLTGFASDNGGQQAGHGRQQARHQAKPKQVVPTQGKIQQAKGVMIRVPINAKGQEYVEASEMRLHLGEEAITDKAMIADAWDREAVAIDANADTHMTTASDDNSFTDDSSTNHSGWGWGWRHHGYRHGFFGYPYYRHHHGYYPYAPYYYGGYRPYYRHHGGLWRFLRPLTYALGGYYGAGYPYYGYRYYYYPYGGYTGGYSGYGDNSGYGFDD